MIIPVGFAQANWTFTGNAVAFPGEVTMGFDVTAWVGDAQDAADFLFTTWADTIGQYQTTATVLSSCLVKYGPNVTGASAIHSGADAGSLADDPAPSAVSWLVRKSTLAGGRAGRGRMYIPGIGDAAVGMQGSIFVANLTAFQVKVDAFLTAVNGADLTPVLLHGAGSPITTPTPITALTADGHVATQRRRQRR